MNQRLQKNILNKSKILWEMVPHYSKGNHFSFIIRKNKIVSFGYNQPFKTDPMAVKYGNEDFPFIHSELHAIKNLPYAPIYLSQCFMINVRLCKKNIKLSKPCENCEKMLKIFELQKIYFTTDQAQFEEMKL